MLAKISEDLQYIIQRELMNRYLSSHRIIPNIPDNIHFNFYSFNNIFWRT